jgi:ribose 5-phosphate isomerase B
MRTVTKPLYFFELKRYIGGMLYIGADHGGFELKEKIKAWLKGAKIAFVDLGASTLDPADDYPSYAFTLAQKVVQNDTSKTSRQKGASNWSSDQVGNESKADMSSQHNLGILLCRSAAGMIIAANKIPGIRAVAVFDEKQTVHAREHNNANVIGISGDWTDFKTAKNIIESFLNTHFSLEPRHQRRLNEIADKEKSMCECENSSGCGCCKE